MQRDNDDDDDGDNSVVEEEGEVAWSRKELAQLGHNVTVTAVE